MRYILVGKQCVCLDAIKRTLENKDRNIITTHVPINKKEGDKMIYIKSRIPYTWEWWVGGTNSEYQMERFVDEVMDFRELNESECDLIFYENEKDLEGTIKKVRDFMKYCEREGNGQLKK